MMKYIYLEFYKIRRKKIGLLLLAMLAVEFLWLSFGLGKTVYQMLLSSPEILHWEVAYMFLNQIKGVILPIGIVILVSRMCDLEHRNNTWRMLVVSSESMKSIFRAKVCAVFLLLVAYHLVECAGMICWTETHTMATGAPLKFLLTMLGGSLLVSFTIAAVQLGISIKMANPLVAMGIGMLGSFLGILYGLLPSWMKMFVFWGYYNELSLLHWNVDKMPGSSFVWSRPEAQCFYLAVGLCLTALFLGERYVSKKEL